MRTTIMGVIFMLVWISLGHTEDIRKVWPNLTQVAIDNSGCGFIQILYNPNIAKPIKFKIINTDPKVIRVMEMRLTSDSKENYIVDYDDGPSCDPGFVLHKKKDGNLIEVFRQWGLTLVDPGDGFLYIAGHTNNMYDQRKKFGLKNGQFCEVSQQYYYVGMKSKLLSPVILYSSQEQKDVVAKLPKGEKVEVILNQGDYYLIKTNIGLLGWLKEEKTDIQTQMEGIFYAGD